MTKSFKRILFVVLTCALLFSTVCMIALNNKVSYASSVAESLAMEEGASVRISSEANGIKYTMTLSADDYDSINKKVADGEYSDVSYGILIAPAYYHDIYELDDPANVFGASAKYNWAVAGEEYKEEEGKVRITNLSSTWLGQYKGGYAMFASIVGIEDKNIANEFISFGYMKYTEGGQEKYVFTAENDNVRSMAYVAQAYIKENPESAYNSVLKETYLDKVVTVASSYTTEYYLEDAEGNFVKADAESVVTDSTIGAVVSPVEKEILGYYFDKDNVNNSSATEVLANNKTVVKLYYKKAVLNADGTFYNSDFSLTEKPEGFGCEVATAWALTSDGNPSEWNRQARPSLGDILLTGNMRNYLESVKMPFEAGKYVKASIDAYGTSGYFNALVYFYNANGEKIQESRMYNAIDTGINTDGYKTHTSSWIVSPADTAYISICLYEFWGTIYWDNAKLYTDITVIEEDGSFFNSDFSLIERPEGAECSKPTGWTYTIDGSWHYYATGTELRLISGWTPLYTESIKMPFEAGVYGKASIDAYTTDVSYFNIYVYFYNANGELIGNNNISNDNAIQNKEAQTYSLWFVSPAETAFISMGIFFNNNSYTYIDNAKLCVVDLSVINEDGSFFNSDFSTKERPEGSDCNKPAGWAYTHLGWSVEARDGYVFLNASNNIISPKLKIEAGMPITVKFSAGGNNYAYLLSSVIFYDANGEDLNASVILNNGYIEALGVGVYKEYVYSAGIAPAGAAYMSININGYGDSNLFIDSVNIIAQ